MSLARAVRSRHSLLRIATGPSSARRSASNHPVQDTAEYPREGFGGSFWRNTVLLSLFGVAFYKYAPEPSKDAYLTRWIALYTVPRDVWLNLNVKHTAMQQEVSEQNILLSEAQLPKVHRYRYPQILEQSSPFLRPVGMDVDVSDVSVKRE